MVEEKMKKKKLVILTVVFLLIISLLSGCAAKGEPVSVPEEENGSSVSGGDSGSGQGEAVAPGVTKNGDVYVLFTSDVHCGIDQGFGYVGLQQIRDSLVAQGYETILVDNGDAVQGEPIGTLTKGEALIDMMNAARYDVAIPGNHEFDYGMERFFELTEKAEYPYVSCNFNYKGELVFEPYVIKECAGMKIAFVGVTTPKSITSSAPTYFQDENGEFVYGFMQDESGQKLYDAVQNAVDNARAEGADLVYLLGHVGNESSCSPWTYAEVISHTNGIDVMLDGHSHDTEQVVMKNKDGQNVVRSACGTKLGCIGYSRISAQKKVAETNIYKWENSVSASELFNLNNAMSVPVREANAKIQEKMEQKVATNDTLLTIYAPERDEEGNRVRMIRRGETNLGDFCADAYLYSTGADIALMNGGGIRQDIAVGDVAYGDIIKVHPFGNQVCVVKAKGQQIIDALEWSVHAVPGEFGGFLQVAGLRYEIDLSVPSSCVIDENGLFIGVEGEYRVKNVFVGAEAIDPEKYYTVAGTDYTLVNHGDGHTAFDGAEVIMECIKLDNQALLDYIVDGLKGNIGEKYADPCGEGRITIINADE